MKTIGIIPARYASTRFPGKPLAMLGGCSILERVFQQAKAVLDRVVIATDDERIEEVVQRFGGEAIRTRSSHTCGTERVCEAYQKLGEDYDVVLNIQGDEPLIRKEQIKSVCDCFAEPDTQIATLAYRITSESAIAEMNEHSPKVVLDKNNNAMYFSRNMIPFIKNETKNEWLHKNSVYKHIGIYGFMPTTLSEVASLQPSSLEMAEGLEQLRWLENGYRIRVAETDEATIGIDTPADLEKAEKYLSKAQKQ